MCNLYEDVLKGKLSEASQQQVLQMLSEHLMHGGPLTLPSRTTFLKRKRDDLIRTTYQLLGEPSIPEYYECLMSTRRLSTGLQYDEVTLMLKSIHSLSNKYDLDIPCQRTIRRIVTNS